MKTDEFKTKAVSSLLFIFVYFFTIFNSNLLILEFHFRSISFLYVTFANSKLPKMG